VGAGTRLRPDGGSLSQNKVILPQRWARLKVDDVVSVQRDVVYPTESFGSQ